MAKSFLNRNEYILNIVEQLLFLPLCAKLSNICGYTLNKTLQAGKAERTEYLLLHAFNQNNVIPPEKLQKTSKDDSKEKIKAQYKGGMVLDPVSGFYPNIILLLDYNSLYPSLIQEYNICFSTVLPLLHKHNLMESVIFDAICLTFLNKRKYMNNKQKCGIFSIFLTKIYHLIRVSGIIFRFEWLCCFN